MRPAELDRYRQRSPLPRPWHMEGTAGAGFAAAVVIPALAEEEHLFATLESLAANPVPLLARTLVLVVVNHRPDASAGQKGENARLLARLAAGEAPACLRLGWVDAASCGRELPTGGGVGLARKIGFDLALSRLDWSAAPHLASLDADTLVEPGYLQALERHFAASPAAAATLPFCHRRAADAAGEAAIGRYELFLRHYVLGLERAGSPYGYHSLGSALACRARAYLRAGGMNRRQAGEDFYFLQQLAKTGGVAPLKGTTVHPSPRVSRRVPFGTGPSVSRLLAGETSAVGFYPAEGFLVLGQWLALVEGGWQEEGEALLAAAANIAPELAAFLAEAGFSGVWHRLCRNHRERQGRLSAFHGWFDALRTLRLVHRLTQCRGGRVEPQQALPPFSPGRGWRRPPG